MEPPDCLRSFHRNPRYGLRRALSYTLEHRSHASENPGVWGRAPGIYPRILLKSHQYRLRIKPSEPRYVLWSAGPDGVDGTTDDIPKPNATRRRTRAGAANATAVGSSNISPALWENRP